MERRQEFIGVRGEIAGCDIQGKPLYRNMYLTDEEIIRCRDCARKDDWVPDGAKCGEDPNGFCAWAERDE